MNTNVGINYFITKQLTKLEDLNKTSIHEADNHIQIIANEVLNEKETLQINKKYTASFVYCIKKLINVMMFPEQKHLILKTMMVALNVHLTNTFSEELELYLAKETDYETLWAKIVCEWIYRQRIPINDLNISEEDILKIASHLTYLHLKKSRYSDSFIQKLLEAAENVKWLIMEEELITTFKGRSFKCWDKLIALSISHCPVFKGELPSQMPRLESLELNFNPVFNSSLPSMPRLGKLEIKYCSSFNQPLSKLNPSAHVAIIYCNNFDEKFLKKFNYQLFYQKNGFLPQLKIKDSNELSKFAQEVSEESYYEQYRLFFKRFASQNFLNSYPMNDPEDSERLQAIVSRLRKYNEKVNLVDLNDYINSDNIQGVMALLLEIQVSHENDPLEPPAAILKNPSFWRQLLSICNVGYLQEIFPFLNKDQKAILLRATTYEDGWLWTRTNKERFHERYFNDHFFQQWLKLVTEKNYVIPTYKQSMELLENVYDQFFDFTHYIPEIIFPYNSKANGWEILNELVDSGHKINKGLLIWLFRSSHYPMIEHTLKKCSDEFLRTNAEEILKECKYMDDPQIGELLSRRYKNYAAHCPVALLEDAVDQGQIIFVEWVFKNGIRLEVEDLNKLHTKSFKKSYLKIIKMIEAYCKAKKTEFKVDMELGIESIKEKKELFKKAFQIALHSPLTEVYEYAKGRQKIKDVLPEALELISLVVRFPREEWFRYATGEKHADFYEKSFEYAQENLTFINQILPEIKTLSRAELLDAIIKYRCDKFKPDDAFHAAVGYKKKQIIEPSIYHTCVDKRYGWSKRHLVPLLIDIDTPFDGNSICRYESHIFYYYTDEDSGKKYPLTELRWKARETLITDDAPFWYHSSSETIAALQNHLEKLHKEIVHFNLDVKDSKSKNLFDAKVARVYWLMATLCEMWRGTPHNVMMWLNIIYKHHGLPPPIPKIEHFFLDNTALMLPYEMFIKRWETFFEPPFEDSLK